MVINMLLSSKTVRKFSLGVVAANLILPALALADGQGGSGAVLLALHERSNTETTQAQGCTQSTPSYQYVSGTRIVNCSPEFDAQLNECLVSCTVQRETGCFPPEAKIMMGDGSYKEAQFIRTGDMVWNPARNMAQAVGTKVKGPEKNAMYVIGYEGATVTVTEEHAMVIRSGIPDEDTVSLHKSSLKEGNEDYDNSKAGFAIKKAMEVKESDMILGKDGEFHEITMLKTLPPTKDMQVYNFKLVSDSRMPQDHMIVADGIVTGDLEIQETIAKK